MKFPKWLDTLLEEKGINTETILEVQGKSGTNIMPLSVVVNAMKRAPAREQHGIKRMLVILDFKAAPILPYFKHLAQAIAI